VEKDDGAKDLLLDVTVPLQALVRNSQLYVSADQTKVCDMVQIHHYHRLTSISQSGIQGFCDPAPYARKELRIRYVFRSRMHYAEISNDSPVVLPLAGEKHKLTSSLLIQLILE
jgi:DnaJ family protein C protein 11